MFTESAFVAAVEESFRQYQIRGARSTKKLKPIHKYFAEIMQEIWGSNFTVHYLGTSTKELTVEGKYYPKDIDVTITQYGKPVFCLGIKFVTSNYKQNANNYFENMMGETANIQALGRLPYAQLIILRRETPYYKKNETKHPSKIEVVNNKDIQKYLNLVFDNPQAHRPNFIGIQVINLDEKTGKVVFTNVRKSFSDNIAKLLKEKLALSNFFNEIAQYKNFYIAKHNG
ncbi:MAG: hypothetical protein LBT46_03885 [Planctomycetaceae bacterium]|jgi:hypothetical protein|nr:hypothetical protein [Planctomycetaceae bacterium]